MRFMFKTDYEDDIRLFPHSGYVWSYGTLLVLLAIAPFVLSSYLMSQLVFVSIYATVGVGLMKDSLCANRQPAKPAIAALIAKDFTL